MARLSAPPITRSEEQRQVLEARVRKHTSPQHKVRRAKVILRAAQGHGIRRTVQPLGVSREMVQRGRRRWRATQEIAAVEARLSEAPRPGAPATYTPEQICAIVALGCEAPEASGRPSPHWTQQELADQALQRGIAKFVSHRAVGHFLKRSRPPPPSCPGVAEHP